MFFLMFGLLWTAISGTIAGALIVSVSKSDVPLSELFFPIVFIGIFVLIGLAFLFVGIKQILRDTMTKRNGRETYGYIFDVHGNGCYVNNRPLYDAEVLLVKEDGTLGVYKENIGTKYNDYYPGLYVFLKHYKNDINIIEIAYEGSVPYNIKNKINEELKNTSKYRSIENDSIYNEEEYGEKETIVIDGVEYVRKK